MASLDDLRTLGYEVGLAFGSTQAEEERLSSLETERARHPDEARFEQEIDALQTSLKVLAREEENRWAAYERRLEEEGAADEPPEDPSLGLLRERLDKTIDNLGAIRQLTREIEFQRRAVVEARKLPTVYVVNGPGIQNVYVALDPAGDKPRDATEQEKIDSLANPDVIREVRFQAEAAPETVQAVFALRTAGFEVAAEVSGGAIAAEIVRPDGKTEKLTTARQIEKRAAELPEAGGK